MNIHSFSIIAGTGACNAVCPYCVSKMTGVKELGVVPKTINWRNFEKACQLAYNNKVDSVLITGKGEPTLFPNQITDYLKKLGNYQFPLIDLQTNGILLQSNPDKYDSFLKDWYNLGLGTIAISVVHYDPQKNKEVYVPGSSCYTDINMLVKKLHAFGFAVRLSCTMVKGYIDSVKEVQKMIKTARLWEVDQLTLRLLAKPSVGEDNGILAWTTQHLVSSRNVKEINDYFNKWGNKLATLNHKAVIYDIAGQNVCFTNALTLKPETDDIRQIIFFPNGRISFDWQYKGAILL